MMTESEKKKPTAVRKRWISDAAPFLTLGLQLAFSVVAFFFLGRWLDSKFDTTPWLMFAGLFVGIVGGFIKFFKTVVSLGKEQEQSSKKSK